MFALAAVAFANVSEDFESYTFGTTASSLTTPGVTFVGAPFEVANTAVLGFALTGQVLFSPACGTPLTMNFDAPQQSISMDYAVAGNPLRLTAYNNGVMVDQQDFNGTVVTVFPQGSAGLSGITFDTVVVEAPSFSDCLAIDDLNTTSAAVPGADPVPLDSRINAFDSAAPVYANGNDGIDIYTISDSEGTYAFSVNNLSDAACDGIITTQGDIVVARTSDCVYQINAPQYNGKTYVMRFDGPFSNSPYTSREDG